MNKELIKSFKLILKMIKLNSNQPKDYQMLEIFTLPKCFKILKNRMIIYTKMNQKYKLEN